MLTKVNHVQVIKVKVIYHAIFEAHLSYGCQISFKSNTKAIQEKMEQLQKKALQIIHFSDFQAHS